MNKHYILKKHNMKVDNFIFDASQLIPWYN